MSLDFSQYGGPSDEWVALEKTLPAMNYDINADPIALRSAVNADRENRMAAGFERLKEQVHTVDYSIPTRDGATIEARTYVSVNQHKSTKLPVYLHLHGGGFIFGTLNSENGACAQIAINTGAVVVNVNYRHTPEHVFPTAWHDAEDAFAWIHKNIDTIGGDASKVVVGGISAGGQLAAALTLEQHLKKSDVTKDLPTLAGQVLIIPCVAAPTTYDQGPGKKLKVSSYVENEFAPVLPKPPEGGHTGPKRHETKPCQFD
jgi:acetyl esterase/lipase